MNVNIHPIQIAPSVHPAAERFDRQRRLLTEDPRFCTLLDAMPDFTMIVNTEREVLFANRTLADFAAARGCPNPVGMRPGEILACRYALHDGHGCGTSDECRYCGAVATILEAQNGRQSVHECRLLRQTPDGPEACDLRIWGTPLIWQEERFVLLAAADISNEKRREVLENIFFHDILNTVGSISLIADMVANGKIPLEEARDELLSAIQSLDSDIRGQRLLLEAERNSLKTQFSLLCVDEILDQVVHLYRKNPLSRNKEIREELESRGACFRSDESLLRRVLGNLLKNALEASAEGETVTLGYRANQAEITFWCHNRGAIPPDVQSRIFQRSFSTKGTGRGTGTYSIKLLTEKYLKGRVSFTSDSGSGTTFTLVLPRNPSSGP